MLSNKHQLSDLKNAPCQKTTRYRAWMKRYGNIGVLMVGCYLGLHYLRTKRRRGLVSVSVVSILLVVVLFWILRLREPKTAPSFSPTEQHVTRVIPPHAQATLSLSRLLEGVERECASTHITPTEPTHQLADLLAKGADPNVRDDQNDTPLIFCSIYGYRSCARLLVEYGANVSAIGMDGRTALAGAMKDAEISRFLLKHGARIDFRDDNGNTALSYSADGFENEGTPEVLRLLIRTGADINAINHDKETALMRAATYGNSAKVRILLGSHANATFRNKEGRTALAIVHHQLAIGHPAYKDYKRALKVFRALGIRE